MENLQQNDKRQKHLNTFNIFINANPANFHEALRDLYRNEDARICKYITEKICRSRKV